MKLKWIKSSEGFSEEIVEKLMFLTVGAVNKTRHLVLGSLKSHLNFVEIEGT